MGTSKQAASRIEQEYDLSTRVLIFLVYSVFPTYFTGHGLLINDYITDYTFDSPVLLNRKYKFSVPVDRKTLQPLSLGPLSYVTPIYPYIVP